MLKRCPERTTSAQMLTVNVAGEGGVDTGAVIAGAPRAKAEQHVGVVGRIDLQDLGALRWDAIQRPSRCRHHAEKQIVPTSRQ